MNDMERRVARRMATTWGLDPDDDEALAMIAGTAGFQFGVLNEQVRVALGEVRATRLGRALMRLGRASARWQDRVRRLRRTR